MLKKKKNETQNTEINTSQSDEQVVLPELEQQNPFVEMYGAVKRAILTIKEDPENPHSNPFFKTIAIDTGQFGRILRNENTEYETAFPAIFIHFINVRYLVQQQRIGEGRATMRVRFILNTLNNSDPERECDPFVVFQRVNIAIQDAKNHEQALNERCNLTYFDMPLSTNMLQGYWIDYEVWFRESSAWKYRGWVEKYLVIPPFTNHDDAPQHDKDGHGNHKKTTDRDVIGIQPSVDDSVDDNQELEGEGEGT